MTAAQRRAQLLDVAKRIVGRDGFHAVSIEAVAREAGITRPVVYGHFGDLPGLLEALVEREGMRALQQLATVVPTGAGDEPPEAQLIAGLRGYLEAVEADPQTWRLVLMPPEGAPAALRESIEQGRAAVIAQLASLVSAGAAPGWESPDPELTARTFSAISDEAARLLLTDAERYPVARLVGHARWLLSRISQPR